MVEVAGEQNPPPMLVKKVNPYLMETKTSKKIKKL
jgi:hypothetical protein